MNIESISQTFLDKLPLFERKVNEHRTIEDETERNKQVIKDLEDLYSLVYFTRKQIDIRYKNVIEEERKRKLEEKKLDIKYQLTSLTKYYMKELSFDSDIHSWSIGSSVFKSQF